MRVVRCVTRSRVYVAFGQQDSVDTCFANGLASVDATLCGLASAVDARCSDDINDDSNDKDNTDSRSSRSNDDNNDSNDSNDDNIDCNDTKLECNFAASRSAGPDRALSNFIFASRFV